VSGREFLMIDGPEHGRIRGIDDPDGIRVPAMRPDAAESDPDGGFYVLHYRVNAFKAGMCLYRVALLDAPDRPDIATALLSLSRRDLDRVRGSL
jgi:hypothetical protein